MFGLESIALAAEHLEKQARKSEQLSVVATVPDDSSSTMSTGSIVPLLPPKVPFGTLPECEHMNKKAPRTVSLDSIDQDLQEEEKKETTTKVPDPPSPSDVIEKVLENDVLCGRGGETNHHPGNVHYRTLVKEQQILYLKAKRRDKPRIARNIVETVRIRGGRFLKKHTGSGTWRDVGNNKAREKTSQALREGAPDLRVCNNPSTEKKQPTKKSNKKRDFDTATGATTTASVATTTGTGCTSVVVSPTPSSASTGLSSMNPRTSSIALSAMVSTDEGSSDSASCYSSQDDTEINHRGPRLKRLKARLSISCASPSDEMKR
mmetsp:Transcript_1863/g.2701  ORF Transcript_1863/g.2701 Transcript_1863/m.2701 type:complete len:320 (-) Transcript_1863:387-1346(-)